MSSRMFQGVVLQMKDSVNRTIGVIDSDGFVVACSELTCIGEHWAGAVDAVNHAENGVAMEDKITDPTTGEESWVMVNVPQSALEQLQATVKIDITPRGVYDRFAQEQSIENLLTQGLFRPDRLAELKIYHRILPDDCVAPKTEIGEAIEYMEQEQRKIATIQARAELMQQRASQFLLEDMDGQASQIAEAMQMQAQGMPMEEAPVEEVPQAV